MSDQQQKIDEHYMAAAIRYARRHEGQTGTNPSVACLLVREKNGERIIVGAGVTAIGGRPHAEPIALAQAGKGAKGATAYVTLEPCAHHGSTPPCAQTLIDAGIARVVTAHVDPDSRVNQLGHELMRKAGIEVSVGCLSDLAEEGLASYLNQKRNNRTYVTVKIAVSSDGIMGIEGQNQIAITGEPAKSYTHMLRARNHAILVGAQTVEADDPDLTCRLEGMEDRSPTRIILDPNGRISTGARVLTTANQTRTMIASTHKISPKRKLDLQTLGAEILNCEMFGNQIALPEFLEDLSNIGIMNVMVEGGAKTVDAFLKADLVDELYYYQGAKSIGIGFDVSQQIKAPISKIELEDSFECASQQMLGADQITHYIRRK